MVRAGRGTFLLWLLQAVWLVSGLSQPAAPRDFSAARQRMVEEQPAAPGRGIKNRLVLEAMRTVPSHEFVPESLRTFAYREEPLPIGYGQFISQPFVVALMTEQLDPQPTDRVLEIGTGSGYQPAVLSQLVAEVYTIEIIEPLAKRAEADLKRLGYLNVKVLAGDGYKGWPDDHPGRYASGSKTLSVAETWDDDRAARRFAGRFCPDDQKAAIR